MKKIIASFFLKANFNPFCVINQMMTELLCALNELLITASYATWLSLLMPMQYNIVNEVMLKKDDFR